MLRWKLLQALESQEAEPSLAPLHLTSLMELWLHLSVTCLLVAQLGNGAKVHLLVVHEGTTGRSPYPPKPGLAQPETAQYWSLPPRSGQPLWLAENRGPPQVAFVQVSTEALERLG